MTMHGKFGEAPSYPPCGASSFSNAAACRLRWPTYAKIWHRYALPAAKREAKCAALPQGVVIHHAGSQGGSVRRLRRGRPLKYYQEGPMTFRLHQAQYDDQTERAYVEFRRTDGDGGDQLAVAVFTFRTKERLTKQRIKEEVVRKARHVLKGAALAA